MRRAAVAIGAVVVLAGCGGEPAVVEPVPEPEAEVVSANGTLVEGWAPRGALVVLEADPPKELPPPEEPAVMDQYGLAFVPELLLVQAGQTVEFRNSEDEAHNVRVNDRVTRDMLFNVAPPRGALYRYTFERPGFYDVTCDAHPHMHATIYVSSTPYATLVQEDDGFRLPQVAPGTYRLRVYAGGEPFEEAVEVSGDRVTVGQAP